MKHALIIGHSGGIGRAVQKELTQRGMTVHALSRGTDGLDITDEDSIAQHLGALSGPYEVIVVATGALEIDGAAPEKALTQLNALNLMAQFQTNAIGPALVLKHAKRLLARKDRAVFAALSARVGSIGDNRLGGWYSYRAAKAALNQLIHGGAIELARSHPQLACVTLHPGTVATRFTEKYQAVHPTVTPEDAATRLCDVMLSLGPQDSGRFLDNAGNDIPW